MTALAVNRTIGGPEPVTTFTGRFDGRFARDMMVTLDTGGVGVMQTMIEPHLLINTSQRIKQEGIRRFHLVVGSQWCTGSE